jgi:hypothetical protein
MDVRDLRELLSIVTVWKPAEHGAAKCSNIFLSKPPHPARQPNGPDDAALFPAPESVLVNAKAACGHSDL